MKNVNRVSTKQHGIMKSGILWFKNATILQARYASALYCSNMWKSNYPYRHVYVIVLHVFVAATRICHEETIFYHQNRVASDSTCWG